MAYKMKGWSPFTKNDDPYAKTKFRHKVASGVKSWFSGDNLKQSYSDNKQKFRNKRRNKNRIMFAPSTTPQR
tara:strand:+ start:297 stop:512 length:216 start_codon:yes stop_codon:yes gene_type:complete